LYLLLHPKDTITAHRNDPRKKKLPKLEDILEMRNGGEYVFFADVCMECVAGKIDWKNQRSTVPMSKVASVTDEAFALLLLDNGYYQWCDMARVDNPTKRSTLAPKYTQGRSKGGSRRYEGWSTEGIDRFNELTDMVKKNRTDYKEWEWVYMADKEREQSEAAMHSGNKRKKRREPQQRTEAIHDDLFASDDATSD
jgi:hypothetical protein